MNENIDVAGTDEGREIHDNSSIHNSSDSDYRFPEYKPKNKVERYNDSDEQVSIWKTSNIYIYTGYVDCMFSY